MKRSTVILAAVLAVMLAAACTKQALKATYDKQITYIESFVANQLKADTTASLTRNGGAYRITLKDTLDKGDSLHQGGRVSLHYACYTLTGASISNSNLVATNIKELAKSAGWNLSDTLRYKLDTLTLDNALLEGLRLGLDGVQPEDEGYILFTGEYAYGNIERGTIPAKSALVYYYLIEELL